METNNCTITRRRESFVFSMIKIIKIFCLTCIAKLKVMNSTIGLRPWKAEPTAIPVNPACKIPNSKGVQ
jgi:hypothetical protein